MKEYKYLFTQLIIIIISFNTYSQVKTVEITDKVHQDYRSFERVLNMDYSGQLIVKVKSGNYKFDRVIKISRSNVVVEFEDNSNIYFTTNYAGIVIAGDNISINNANFIGNGKSSKDIYSGFGILVNGVNNLKISNNTFRHISGIPIFISRSALGKGTSNAVVSNNVISDVALTPRKDGDEAAILIGYSGHNYFHTDIMVRNNVIDGNSKLNIGIGIIGHGKNNSIIKNRITNFRSYGIIAYESIYTDKSLFNTNIESNHIENIGRIDGQLTKKGMGIYLMKSQNSRIVNNTVINTLLGNDKSETLGSGAITLNGSINSLVSGNIIRKSNMYGITNAYAFNTPIIENTISDISKSAIYLINVNDLSIRNNNIYNSVETVFKGFFENTSLYYIRKTWKFAKYQNINTGNNIIIDSNNIWNSGQVISFVSYGANPNYKGEKYHGNKLGNNKFINNKVNDKSFELNDHVKNRLGLL